MRKTKLVFEEKYCIGQSHRLLHKPSANGVGFILSYHTHMSKSIASPPLRPSIALFLFRSSEYCRRSVVDTPRNPRRLASSRDTLGGGFKRTGEWRGTEIERHMREEGKKKAPCVQNTRSESREAPHSCVRCCCCWSNPLLLRFTLCRGGTGGGRGVGAAKAVGEGGIYCTIFHVEAAKECPFFIHPYPFSLLTLSPLYTTHCFMFHLSFGHFCWSFLSLSNAFPSSFFLQERFCIYE